MSGVPLADRRIVGAFIRRQRLRTPLDRYPQLHQRRRHVAHLSQSDLAELAGISVSLVGQVENGRYGNLNPPLVHKLAQALDFSPHQRQYVLNFVQSPHSPHQEEDEVPRSVRSVVDAAEPNPTVLINPRFDILHWNRSASAMLADFGKLPRHQRNVVLTMFCVPEMRVVWEDWESNARNMVAGLRMQASHYPAYRTAIHKLAHELGQIDPLFGEWWTEEEPLVQPHREKDFLHPTLGRLRLYQTVSEVLGSPHLSLLVYTPRDDATARLFREF